MTRLCHRAEHKTQTKENKNACYIISVATFSSLSWKILNKEKVYLALSSGFSLSISLLYRPNQLKFGTFIPQVFTIYKEQQVFRRLSESKESSGMKSSIERNWRMTLPFFNLKGALSQARRWTLCVCQNRIKRSNQKHNASLQVHKMQMFKTLYLTSCCQ